MTDLDDTEQALVESLRRWLADHVDTATQARADLPPAPPVWRALADDLGLLGAGLPEAAGGLGGGLRTQLLVLQTLGEALAAEPYRSAALVGGAALQAGASPLLQGLVQGDVLPAWAHTEPGARGLDDPLSTTLQPQGAGWRLHGRKSAVVAAAQATHFIVTATLQGQPVVLCVEAAAPGITRRDVRTLDGGSAQELQFDDTPLPADARLGGADLLQRLQDLAVLGLCAESLGVTQRLLDDTREHLRTRTQFGVPLASQQVLQHRLADMHIARLQAQALTWAVVAGVDAATVDERALAVSSAKVAAGRACRVVGQGAVQLHGAMGVTEEAAVGRWFRRATQIEALCGSSAQHLRRIDALLNLDR